MSTNLEMKMAWTDICSEDDLILNSGVCALIGNEQVAVFTLLKQDQKHCYAIGNWDPIGEANVLYRGILGSIGDDIVVASPLYKQHFSLLTGKCHEQEGQSVPVYDVRLEQGRVLLGSFQ